MNRRHARRARTSVGFDLYNRFMDRHFTEPLRERGVRITPQRAFIWQALASSDDHFTAEELWERVRAVLPGLEISTVYRSLEALAGAGLVVESRVGEGPRIFEARSAPHPHLVCEKCGRISHLDSAAGGRILGALEAESEGFETHELHIFATGVCADCAEGTE
ncbi:MAG: transcriptional repressor [Actinomycetota bacterium]|jgi:Fur family peroxide stress response transcriptional regulator|nr:transcriptional repressor [Rubrobacter sp.]MDQ3509960.1 transcriptional repressor [Actinomycetota bacterium]